MSAPVVITGVGVTAPNGLGTRDYWSATLEGRSGIDVVSRFDPEQYPSRLAGEVPGFEPTEHLPRKLIPQTDHMTRLALVAADWAIADAGVVPEELSEFDMGVVTASSSGGFEFGHRELQNLCAKGNEYVSAYQSFAWFYAVNTGQISIRNGMRGPSGVVVSDQAGGLDAVAQARRQIRKGVELVVSGGVDGSICPWGWVAQMAGGRLSPVNDAERAYLPFDSEAAGHVPGEGGAILLVEDREAARRRGADDVYAEVAGYGATLDPPPGSGREPGLRRAVELALRDASVGPDEVDAVFADAAAVPELDRVEAEVITELFGEYGVPVTAPKTMTGRLYSGAAALDLVAAVLAIRDGVVPPTVNVSGAPEYALDLVVGSPRAADLGTAMVLARGQGGFNSAMIVRRPD
ncbi:act minimal PKS chain-length factor (CLF/KS beta) [Actinopolyspora biskrensis]|uniref:Act minimal PKS chain-length factor (CLF/KS beta) n=1 Tax=Actinopolyspora biskrensis TaxID=1470178 RepID=A0A852Z440_9ACTN|nr:ketosynthase chain-length factor [Actinopolyspora biskrensis]NYH80930.1 act minimal PKS chain-length factor (CLF/KS beta) [Actinopolyspora biskrensis]